MIRLIHAAVDAGRLTDDPRSRLFSGDKPLFSWGVQRADGGGRQTACRAQVTADGIEWDSGWVLREEQSLRYQGPPLPEGEPVRLTLTVRDDRGHESEPWSADLYRADVAWRAPWIGAGEDVPGRVNYFRRDVHIDGPLRTAVLYACGIGYHQLYLNGEPLDDAALEPAHTDYSKTCQYVTYPLLHERLRQGANCIGAMVGDGWRCNRLVTSDRFSDREGGIAFSGRQQFTAMLRLTYEDGRTQWMLSDNGWQWGYGMLAASDLFDGETWDAARAQPGWNLPGFTGFAQAVEVPGPGGCMKPMLIPPIREGKAYAPVAMWRLDSGAVLADFGHNVAGVVRLRLPRLAQGHTIRISHAEELTEEGDLYTAPLRDAAATDTYIAAGDGRDLSLWQPMFTYHGFRYARIEGLPMLSPDDIEAVSLHTAMDTRSFFRCGDALVTAIHEACVATERANQHSILTDCPQRDERMGWLNDATVRFEATPYNFDIGRVFPKVVRDVMDAQSADGAITCTAPYVFGARPADPVSSSFLVAAWQHCLYTGSLDLVEEGYERFAAWQRCLMDNSKDHIVTYSHYGDWAGPEYACESNEIPRSAVTPGVFMSTGFSYYNCVLMARFARLLGDEKDAVQWDGRAGEIRTAMLNKWYHPDTAQMATGSQACQAFALWLGLLPQSDAPRAAARISEELRQNGYRITTGNLCTKYLMDVLCDHGYVDDAWRLITRQVYPSWGFMLQNEATTIWERFELKKNPGMNSHSHPMYGAVDGWLYSRIAGIRPAAPGFRRVLIAPHMPADLLSAQAVVDTIRGDVAVRWMKRYGAAHLHLTVPFGVEAEVRFGGKTHEVGAGFHVFNEKLPA